MMVMIMGAVPKRLLELKQYFWLIAPGALVVLLGLQLWQQIHLVPAVSKTTRVASVATIAPLPQAVPVAAVAPVAIPVTTKVSKTSVAKTKVAATPVSTTDIASATICPGQDQIGEASAVLLCMTNYARKFHGLGTVTASSILTDAAAAKANDIVTCDEFSHTACQRTSNYWITTKGYNGNCSAENIAEGQKSPRQVFVAWMNSAGHRANILGANYIHLGVAQQASSHGPTWVMELGGC